MLGQNGTTVLAIVAKSSDATPNDINMPPEQNLRTVLVSAGD
jgi:hypothetical protein